ncbi:MAG: efflux RND transporter periplasmic adaptor subunit [Candidatus Magnetomorum sp.]|nr:efflux RND transporter periplasmic adaptor subunit [Candidatus Magnetomorum sp.]
MTQALDSINQETSHQNHFERKGLKKSVSFILCLIILSSAVAVTIYLKNSRIKPKKKQPVPMLTYVNVIPAHLTDQSVKINASGTVVPARELTVKSRVSGEIVYVHPELIEGGMISKGTEIIRIDPDDYELAIIKAKRDVIQAEYALKLEQGHQAVALQEWSLMHKGKEKNPSADTDLILRKPHLAKVKGDLAAAQADLKKAELNLQRTKIVVPFNAFVRSKHIEVGSQVSLQEGLVDLVGTDNYWIQVAMPLDRLKWIDIPVNRSDQGTYVTVTYQNIFSINGRVIKCLGELETQGHMAQLIVQVDGPSAITKTQAPPLLIGEYVSVQLSGKSLKNACQLPRIALRHNQWIWVALPDKTLDIRTVGVGFRDTDEVFIEKGLSNGDQVIVSEISAPVQGMKLHVE